MTRAERLWREVIEVDPGFVPGYQRLGTLLMRRREFDEAGQVLETAEALAREQLAERHDTTLDQRLGLIRRDLGVTYWRQSERVDSADERSNLLIKAIKVTHSTLTACSENRLSKILAANAIYCLSDLKQLDVAWNIGFAELANEVLESLRLAVNFGTWTREKGWSDFALDSVMRGESTFGNAETARSVAKELLRRLNQKLAALTDPGARRGAALGLLSADDQDIYHIASQIIAESGN